MKGILGGVILSVIAVIAAQFMYVLPIHIGVFFVTIITVIISDVYGLLWMIGKVKMIPLKVLSKLHLIVTAGLMLMITTGLLMAWPVKDYLFTTPGFIIKMCFVGALVVNAFFINSHVTIASVNSFSELPKNTKIKLIVSGMVSGFSWFSAFIAAQFIGL